MISNQNLDDNIKRVPPTYSGAEAEDALVNSLEGSFRVEVSTGINNELFLALGSLVGYAMIMQFVPEEGGRVQVAVGPDGRSSTRTHNGESWGSWFVNGLAIYRNVTAEFVNNYRANHSWLGILPIDGHEDAGLEVNDKWYMILNIADSNSYHIPMGSFGHSSQLAFGHGGGVFHRVSDNQGWSGWKRLMYSEEPNLRGTMKFYSENRNYEFLRFFECGGPQSQYGWPGCHVQLCAGQSLILGAGECSTPWWELMKERTEGTFDSETVWIVSDRAIKFFYNQADNLDESKCLHITTDGHLLLPITPTHSRGAVPKSYVDALAARVKALEDKLK